MTPPSGESPPRRTHPLTEGEEKGLRVTVARHRGPINPEYVDALFATLDAARAERDDLRDEAIRAADHAATVVDALAERTREVEEARANRYADERVNFANVKRIQLREQQLAAAETALAEARAEVADATEAWQLHGKYGLTIDSLKTGAEKVAFGPLPEGWSWGRVLILPARGGPTNG